MFKKDIAVPHVANNLHPSLGGPSRTVVELADVLSLRPNLNIHLLSQGIEGQPSVSSQSNLVKRVTATSRTSLELFLS